MAERVVLAPPSPLLKQLLRDMKVAALLAPLPGMEKETAEVMEAFKRFFLLDKGIDPDG